MDDRYVLNPRYASEQEEVDAYFLVNGRLSYLLLTGESGLASEVFLAFENLFDEDYEHRPGYPMPGFTVTGGVEVRF